MPSNEIMSLEGQLCGIPLAGPESFSAQQLDYLKRALGVDETVLFESQNGETGGFTLSESVANFETIKIIYSPSNAEGGVTQYNYGKEVALFDGTNMAACQKVALTGMMPDGGTSYTLVIRIRSFTLDATGKTFTSGHSHQVYYNGSAWSRAGSTTYIYKVVGIHRIAGGN